MPTCRLRIGHPISALTQRPEPRRLGAAARGASQGARSAAVDKRRGHDGRRAARRRPVLAGAPRFGWRIVRRPRSGAAQPPRPRNLAGARRATNDLRSHGDSGARRIGVMADARDRAWRAGSLRAAHFPSRTILARARTCAICLSTSRHAYRRGALLEPQAVACDMRHACAARALPKPGAARLPSRKFPSVSLALAVCLRVGAGDVRCPAVLAG